MDIDAGQNLHYLDNAATTFPKPTEVLNFMIDFCSRACVNPGRSTFDLALEAETVLLSARQKLRQSMPEKDVVPKYHRRGATC